jgi:tetratricopeptide (TPR) repeat protein
MMRGWYALSFAFAVLALTIGGLFAFRRLASNANAELVASTPAPWRQDSVRPPKPFIPIMAGADEYARYAAEDAAWRQRNARQYTVSELRARGDGTRSPQQALEDRVYAHTRRGDKAGAIAELERWVAKHPADERALLSLARLLNETGRNADAIERYRQLLAAKERSGNQ